MLAMFSYLRATDYRITENNLAGLIFTMKGRGVLYFSFNDIGREILIFSGITTLRGGGHTPRDLSSRYVK